MSSAKRQPFVLGPMYKIPPFLQPSEIDSSSTKGDQPSSLTGDIDFDDVHFHYPARPDVKVSSVMALVHNLLILALCEGKPPMTVMMAHEIVMTWSSWPARHPYPLFYVV